MDDTQNTIGLPDLLTEVDHDLEEWRKKNPGDYAIKNTVLWWQLERERLVVRHNSARIVRRMRHGYGARLVALFCAGWLSMLAAQAALRWLVP